MLLLRHRTLVLCWHRIKFSFADTNMRLGSPTFPIFSLLVEECCIYTPPALKQFIKYRYEYAEHVAQVCLQYWVKQTMCGLRGKTQGGCLKIPAHQIKVCLLRTCSWDSVYNDWKSIRLAVYSSMNIAQMRVCEGENSLWSAACCS